MLTTQFIGRAQELDLIKGCWEKAKKREPQVVNLIADTGVGKTRIVHAFYEWLSLDALQSDDVNQNVYWPKTLGTSRQRSVNPLASEFGTFDFKDDSIPWLWWGMYWTDVDGEQTVALSQFYDQLVNHLKMLEIEQETKRKNWKAVLESFAEEGLDFALDFVPGATQVKNVGKLLNKVQSNRKRRDELARGLAQKQLSLVERMEEDILQRLGRLYNSTKGGVSVTPLVIFLDDIHFATDKRKDGKTLSFLEGILRQSAQNHWPLLVIATHWESEWRDHLNGPTLEEGKPWRRIIDGLENKEDLDKPTCSSLQISNIDINNIDENQLREVIKSTLPGLNEDNRGLILNRVDNVRWLVEVLTALNDNADNFINQNRLEALSEFGIKRLDELLKSSDYLDVIRQRLSSDAMKQLRPLLGAAAFHTRGLDFLGAFIQVIGQSLIEQSVLKVESRDVESTISELVTRAIDPASFLEGNLTDNSPQQIVRFPERGYLEVARELFDKSYLPLIRQELAREIVDWLKPDEKDESGQSLARWQKLPAEEEQLVFLEVAYQVLISVAPQLTEAQLEKLAFKEEVYKEQVADGDMTEARMKEKLEEARQKLLSENENTRIPDAEKWLLHVTIELVGLLDSRDDRRAYALSSAIGDSDLQEHLTFGAISENALFRLIDILGSSTSRWLLSKRVCDELIGSFYKDGSTAGLDEAELLKLSDFYITRGKLWKENGKLNAAKSDFLEAYKINDSLRKSEKFNVTYCYNISDTIACIADLYIDVGKEQEARKLYMEALTIDERVLNEFGVTKLRLQRCASLLHVIADIDITAGHIKAASQGFMRCKNIDERLLHEFGETPEQLRNYSCTLEGLARAEQEVRNFDVARDQYLRALEIRDRLLREFGETPDKLIGVAAIRDKLARLEKEAGNLIKARENFIICLNIDEYLLKEFGESFARLENFSRSLYALACLDYNNGNLEWAREGYLRCREISKVLLDRFGTTSKRLEYFFNSTFGAGLLDKELGNLDSARKGLMSAIQIKEYVVMNFERTSSDLMSIGLAHSLIAELEKSESNTSLALESYKVALSVLDRMSLEFDPSSDGLLLQIAAAYEIATLERTSNNLKAAQQHYLYVIEIGKKYKMCFTENDDVNQHIDCAKEALNSINAT